MNFTDIEFKNQAIDNLKTARTILIELGVPFFLSNGTLLGAIRDNDLIAHDMDVDTGIFSKYIDRAAEIEAKFKENDFIVFGIFGTFDNGYQFSFKRGGVKFDIFFYYMEGDKHVMSVWREKQFKYLYPQIEGLIPRNFLGESFYIPRNYEQYLEAQYGDWKTPVKQWDCYISPKNIS